MTANSTEDPTEPTRFTAEDPIPQPIWERWLDESYALSLAKKSRKKAKK